MSKIINKPLMGVFKTGKWQSIPDTTIVKNGISEITLRGWQSEILDQRDSKLPHLFINCPTGAGKSKAALAIIVNDEKDSDKLVIISAPQKEIGKGFLSTTGDPQKILDHVWMINPANQLCEGYYNNENGNIDHLKEFLKVPRSKDLNDRILVCCHATLAMLFDRMSQYEKTKYLQGVKLCVDESHHSLSQEDEENESGNGLGKVVNYFLKHSDKNLDLMMMTATPFRGDKGSLIPDKFLKDFYRYDLDYGRHFEENCKGLEFTYNAVLHQYGEDYGNVIKTLLDKHLEDGDKVLVQIPPSNAGISNGKFNDLQMIYDAIGEEQIVNGNGIVLINRDDKLVKVLDLVTINSEECVGHLKTNISREQRLDYLRKNPTDIDIVIGISMIKEGFDWPCANAGILIGSQGSLNAQIQLMGRMFRAYENKGKDNGMSPVKISQIFPYVDHEKLDEDEVREQINTFMKIVYAALAMELVINPIHIDIPIKTENETKTRKSVKNFLTETLTDTQYTELLSNVMDDFRDWKATAEEGESNSKKMAEIVSEKLTELGITENHKEVAEFFNKSLQRSAKFQIMATEGIDVSHIDIELMVDIEDPIDSILMGMSNGLCGAANIREFQKLMKPVDTLRRCYELKEWVESKGNWPKDRSGNVEQSFFTFIKNLRMAKRKTKTDFNLSEDMEEVLNSFGFDWKDLENDKTLINLIKLNEFKRHHGRIPSAYSSDNVEKSLSYFQKSVRDSYKGVGNLKLSDIHTSYIKDSMSWFKFNPNSEDRFFKRCKELYDWVEINGKYPHSRNDRSLYSIITTARQIKKGGGDGTKLSEDSVKILESIPNWRW